MQLEIRSIPYADTTTTTAFQNTKFQGDIIFIANVLNYHGTVQLFIASNFDVNDNTHKSN